jgi:hypothetical protein
VNRVALSLLALAALSGQSAISVAQTGVRLFLTPQVRLELERRRLGIVDIAPELEAPALVTATDSADQEPEAEIVFALGGSVIKSDGSATVWLNGAAVDEKDLPRGVRIPKPAAMGRLSINSNDQEYIIKPGQVLNATTGVVYESYQWQQKLELQRIEELADAAANQAEEVADSPSEQAP